MQHARALCRCSETRLTVKRQAVSTSGGLKATQADTIRTPKMAPGLPATYKRLVANRTGESFRDVADVEETSMPVPRGTEVSRIMVHTLLQQLPHQSFLLAGKRIGCCS